MPDIANRNIRDTTEILPQRCVFTNNRPVFRSEFHTNTICVEIEPANISAGRSAGNDACWIHF